jgi:hypothetical protein
METELKKLPKYGEGKEAQTSPQYLERAIESARKEIEDLTRKYVGISEIFGQTDHGEFVELLDKICSIMERHGFNRMDDGDVGTGNGREEIVTIAFAPGTVVIAHFNCEPVEFDYGSDTRITLRSVRMVNLN